MRRGCFELLLVLAESIAQPLPQQTPEALRDSARQALQYAQDPSMRKMMIAQYRAAGIDIPEDA